MPPPSSHVSSLAPSPFPSSASRLPSVSRPSLSVFSSLHTSVFRLLSLFSTPHSSALALSRRPLGPRSLSTPRHRPSSASSTSPPSDTVRSNMTERRASVRPSVWPIRPNKMAFVRPNRTEPLCLILFGRTGSRCRKEEGDESGTKEEGTGERKGDRKGRKGEETEAALKRRGAGKGEEMGQCRRGGGEGRRRTKEGVVGRKRRVI